MSFLSIIMQIFRYRLKGGDTGSTHSFEPYDARVTEKPTETWQALMHVLKGMIGTGVMALPYGFAQIGYLEGALATLVLTIIAAHCTHMLFTSMHRVARKQHVPYVDYAKSFEFCVLHGSSLFCCLRPMASYLVDVFIIVYSFASCTSYVVFAAANWKQVCDEYIGVMDIRLHILTLIVPCILLTSIRNLRFLSFFSAMANIFMLIGFISIFFYIFRFLPPLSDRSAFLSLDRFPKYFGIVIFSLGSVGVMLSVERSMLKPAEFLTPFGVLNIGMAATGILYSAVGFLGYWAYGDEIMGSITLNIPVKEIAAQIVKFLFFLAIMVNYCLNTHPIMDVCWKDSLAKRFSDEEKTTTKFFLYEFGVRVILVLLTIIFALILPSIQAVVALIGSVMFTSIGLLFPTIMDMCLRSMDKNNGPFKIFLIKNILILIFGIIATLYGIYEGYLDIVKMYS